MPTYTPRLTQGNIYDANNPYYVTYNHFPPTYSVGLPNCTCYCYGRWNEISAVTQDPGWGFYGNGGDWYREGVIAGYQHDTNWNPQVGALISWNYGDAGHVAVVEQIIYDANNNPIGIITSNSAWRREYAQGGEAANTNGCAPNFEWQDPTTGTANGFPFFYLNTVYASNPDAGNGAGSFNGFIYHPDFPPDVPPTPPVPVISKSLPLWGVSLPNRIRRIRHGNR